MKPDMFYISVNLVCLIGGTYFAIINKLTFSLVALCIAYLCLLLAYNFVLFESRTVKSYE